jgi:hypothetical protein
MDFAVKVLQLISLPMLIVLTIYLTFSAYLSEYWKGFMLGALVTFLPMLIFWAYREKGNRSNTCDQAARARTGSRARFLSRKNAHNTSIG